MHLLNKLLKLLNKLPLCIKVSKEEEKGTKLRMMITLLSIVLKALNTL